MWLFILVLRYVTVEAPICGSTEDLILFAFSVSFSKLLALQFFAWHRNRMTDAWNIIFVEIFSGCRSRHVSLLRCLLLTVDDPSWAGYSRTNCLCRCRGCYPVRCEGILQWQLTCSGHDALVMVQVEAVNRLPGVWDDETPREQFCGRLVKQLSRITLIAIVMFPVCVFRVTLCYVFNLSG